MCLGTWLEVRGEGAGTGEGRTGGAEDGEPGHTFSLGGPGARDPTERITGSLWLGTGAAGCEPAQDSSAWSRRPRAMGKLCPDAVADL